MRLSPLTDSTQSTQQSTQPPLATTSPTATTQPVTKPKPPTSPTDLSGALPMAGTQPAGSPVPALPTGPAPTAPTPAPTSPPPLATSDPLAFSPAPTQPYTVPGGSTFIGGTQTVDANGNVTNPGILGTQFVPGTNGMLVDGGNGMFAPTPGVDVSGGVLQVADPIITQGYQAPGTVTSAGKIVGMTYDANGNPQPLYDSGVTDPNVAPTQAGAPTTSQLLAAIVNGTSAAPGAPQPNSTTGAGSNGTLIPTNPPKLTAGSPSGPTPGGANIDPLAGTGLTLPPAASGTPGSTPGSSPGTGSPIPPVATPIAPGVSGYQTTPDNALTNETLLPDNNVDRVKLAQDALSSTIQNVLEPQFQARERDLNRYNFGAGRGVSGDARTSQGTLASDYGNQIANLSNSLLTNATTGSIDDMYRNLGLALQEQAFQEGQQGQAFGENFSLQQLADAENGQSFGQALQQLMAGSNNNPANIALVLSQIFGSQAGQAGQAASNYVAAEQQNNNATQQNQTLQNYLDSLLMDQILNRGVPGVQTTGAY